jgi:predicted nuclease of predicted toxin-antitoxin system
LTERIRFHLDENVDPDVARALRRHGIDVTTTAEAGLLTTEDAAQLAYAIREGRVIVTHDADFLRMAAQGIEHVGIAYCHKAARSLGEIIRTLMLIYEVLEPEEIMGRVEYL